MTKEQYKRANGTVYPVIVIIMAYLLLTLVAFIVRVPGAGTWKTYLQIVVSVFCVILVSIAAIRVVKLLIKFNGENMQVITDIRFR